MSEDKEKRATFTPGPWHAFEQCSYSATKGLFEIDANHPSGNRQTIAVTPFAGDGHELWANARLIAAAPELHAQAKVLERLLTELAMQGETGTDEALEEVRAVLAKVDGGEG